MKIPTFTTVSSGDLPEIFPASIGRGAEDVERAKNEGEARSLAFV
jgi:hypothetical protein